MRLGLSFPEREMGTDPDVIREYAQLAEELGYEFIVVADHVLGAERQHHTDLLGPYGHDSLVHEPFVLFSFIAAWTERIELMTNIIILPQRQTALVAKQAAELDVLSRGRLVLGVGNGWNPVEYEALGQDFHTRGRRLEEQVQLLRALWEQPVVNFEGRFHRITHAGINPRPNRRIPIWMGGMAGRVLQRIGKYADGWAPRLLYDDLERAEADMSRRRNRIREAAIEAGRDPDAIGLLLRTSGTDVGALVERARHIDSLGATHCALDTASDESYTQPGSGLSPEEHMQLMREFMAAYRAAT